MSKTVNLIDQTLRDAHQCLWATRMTTGMMRDVAPLLDRAGFEAIDLVGGLGGGEFLVEAQAQMHIAAIVVGQQGGCVQVDVGGDR